MLSRPFCLLSLAKRHSIGSQPRNSVKAFWHVSLLIVVVGCSNRPGAIRPPKVNAEDAASTIVRQLDRDGDGKLAQSEWSNSPEIGAVATNYDKNADGLL